MVQTRNGTAVAVADGNKALSLLLAAIGVTALVTSVWMNARFGWGLSPNLADRTTLAISSRDCRSGGRRHHSGGWADVALRQETAGYWPSRLCWAAHRLFHAQCIWLHVD